MFERDYLMRLIVQAAKALGAVAGLRDQKKHEQALEHIDEFMSKELRLKSRLALGLPDKDLLAMLSLGGVPNAQSVAIIAAFLQEEGELLDELGRQDESVPRFAKALRLNLYLLDAFGTVDGWELEPRVGRLLQALAPYEWDAETTRSVWHWRQACGEWDKAEDMLYDLLELSAVRLAEGIAFYDRLALLDDDALEAGGLPRHELEEGRQQWVVAAASKDTHVRQTR